MNLTPKPRGRGLRLAVFAPALAGSLLAYGAALAQTTGQSTVDAVVVTATRKAAIGGIIKPQEAPKGIAEIGQSYISTQTAGMNPFQSLNLLPGVSYTSDDAYGMSGSGGHMRLHGLDFSRIAVMMDGMPLNDSGNYAVYPAEYLDPEVIDRVTVVTGSADSDTATASSVGGSINIKSINPSDAFGGFIQASTGSFAYARISGLLNTGAIGPWGTKAYVEVSDTGAEPYVGYGRNTKLNLSAKVFQDLHHYDDYFSLAFFYDDQLFYNKYGEDLPTYNADGSVHAAGEPWNSTYLPIYYNPTPVSGTAQNANVAATTACHAIPNISPYMSCVGSNYYQDQINPTQLWNLRGNFKYTFIPNHLILTVDPSFQSILADGGTQTTGLAEYSTQLIGTATSFPTCKVGSATKGVDLNGDGDCLDSVRIFDPSLTHTERVTVNSSLIWTINPDQLIRVGYTYDHSHHRQDGPADFINADGSVPCPYGFYESCGTPVLAADGSLVQRRNRLTIMENNQFTAEYFGKFFNEHLSMNLGLRDPHYSRELNQYCWSNITGSVYCSNAAPINPTTGAGIPVTGLSSGSNFIIPPWHAHVSYTKALPQAGLAWRFDSANQVYFNYAEQYRLPVNDDLYTVGYDTATKSILFNGVQPESSQTFELGYRFQTPSLLASATLWDTEFKNRIVSSYNQDLDTTTDRNVGTVSLRGVDLAAGWKPPVRGLSLSGTFSYVYSRFDDNVTDFNAAGLIEPTRGKELPETPKITVGGRVQYSLGDFDVGLQGKYTSSRWVTDLNDLKVAGFTVFDLDVRWRLDRIRPGSYIQFNATNLFNARYFGSLANENPTNIVSSPFYNGASYAYQGPPRTLSITWRQAF